MDHKISKVKVYQTTDYKLFKKVEGNRPLNKKKIERIIAEINNGNDILDEVPILVSESKNFMEVLEGQHRLEIATQLKRPVHYIIHKTRMNLYEVAKVNSNVEKWKGEDFINCYSTAGNENYKQIDKFQKKYGFALGVCLALLHSGGMIADYGLQADLSKKFEMGEYEVKKYKEAVALAEICKAFDQFRQWSTRGFIIAITKIIKAEKCDMDILVKKFLEDPKKLLIQPDWKKYLTNLEEIYNVGYSKRRVIF